MFRELLRKVIPLRGKILIAKIIGGDFAGALIRFVIGDTITHRNMCIRIDHPRVTGSMVGALFWQYYERAEADQITKYLPKAADVIELGASSGVNTTLIASLLEDGFRVISVEADPELCSLAHENCGLNGLTDRVEFLSAAVHYDGPRVSFFRDALSVGGHTNPPPGAQVRDNRAAFMVPAITLSQIATKYQLRGYTLVMDIEGAEWEIVHRKGELDDCERVIAELHEIEEGDQVRSVDDLILQFEAQGFELMNRDGRCVVLARSSGQSRV